MAEKQYALLKAGTSGTVFFVETGRCNGTPGSFTLHRYRLSERKSELFIASVAEYAVSADGKKLRLPRRRPPLAGPRGGPPEQRRPSSSSWTPTRRHPRPATAS